MDIKKLSAQEFLNLYSKYYIDIFNLDYKDVLVLASHDQFRDKIFYVLCKSDNLLAFMSVRLVEQSTLELGDVAKANKSLLRSEFIQFMKIVFESYSEYTIIGYPNPLALKLELGAGFEVIQRYNKKLIIVLGFISIEVPVYRPPNGFRLGVGRLRIIFGLRYRKCRLRNLLAKSDAGSLHHVGLSIRYEEHKNGDHYFISFHGRKCELIDFAVSDNSF